jgi:hypothetical protein
MLNFRSGATYISFSSGGSTFSSKAAAGRGQGTSGGKMATVGMGLETTILASASGNSVDGGWMGLFNGLGTEEELETDRDSGKVFRDIPIGSFRVDVA